MRPHASCIFSIRGNRVEKVPNNSFFAKEWNAFALAFLLHPSIIRERESGLGRLRKLGVFSRAWKNGSGTRSSVEAAMELVTMCTAVKAVK